MIQLFETYLAYLASHPDLINSIILWNITMAFVYFNLLRLKPVMVEGAKGVNGLFESNEQVIYLLNWVWPGILSYAAFFNAEFNVWVWGLIASIIGYTIGGRWLFEWALAFKTGKSSVESSTETNVKVETKTQTQG